MIRAGRCFQPSRNARARAENACFCSLNENNIRDICQDCSLFLIKNPRQTLWPDGSFPRFCFGKAGQRSTGFASPWASWRVPDRGFPSSQLLLGQGPDPGHRLRCRLKADDPKPAGFLFVATDALASPGAWTGPRAFAPSSPSPIGGPASGTTLPPKRTWSPVSRISWRPAPGRRASAVTAGATPKTGEQTRRRYIY